MKHKCTQEVTIQKLKDKQKYLDIVLNGNGKEEIGLIKKMADACDAILKMKYYTHIKNWILYITASVLFGIVMFLLGFKQLPLP